MLLVFVSACRPRNARTVWYVFVSLQMIEFVSSRQAVEGAQQSHSQVFIQAIQHDQSRLDLFTRLGRPGRSADFMSSVRDQL
jgi:hypothetical protein